MWWHPPPAPDSLARRSAMPACKILQPQPGARAAQFDTPHTLTLNAVYELPFGRGKPLLNQNRVAGWIAGGWQWSGIESYRSGAPALAALRHQHAGELRRRATSELERAEHLYQRSDHYAADQLFQRGGVQRACGIHLRQRGAFGTPGCARRPMPTWISRSTGTSASTSGSICNSARKRSIC